MRTAIIVRAFWDDEAQVWVATSSDVDGLAIEADSWESLEPRVTGALRDLLECAGEEVGDIPVHIHAERRTHLHLAEAI